MRVTIKKGAPSLRNHMNRGGKFGDWRHQWTNYDDITKVLRGRFGFDSVEYRALVAEFGAECLAALSNEAHKAAVVEWAGSKGV